MQRSTCACHRFRLQPPPFSTLAACMMRGVGPETSFVPGYPLCLHIGKIQESVCCMHSGSGWRTPCTKSGMARMTRHALGTASIESTTSFGSRIKFVLRNGTPSKSTALLSKLNWRSFDAREETSSGNADLPGGSRAAAGGAGPPHDA